MTRLNQQQQSMASVFQTLAALPESHQKSSPDYAVFKQDLSSWIEQQYQDEGCPSFMLSDNRTFSLPYYEMGNINTKHLLGIDELIILAFYQSANGYQKFLDLGANIGLHSIVASCAGMQVTAYEPDPETFAQLQKNLQLNQCQVETCMRAVASYDGQASFTRVEGNRTGSHLTGNKQNVYGGQTTFDVDVENIIPRIKDFDLIKMDIEGQEQDVFCHTQESDWQSTDLFMEINGEQARQAIFNHTQNLKLNIFSQNSGWQRVKNEEQLPLNHNDGNVFITKKAHMPWASGSV